MVVVAVCRMHPAQMAQQRTSGLARAASVGVPHNWGYDDDALLAALVVEYSLNWHFIADTCSSTCVLQVRPGCCCLLGASVECWYNASMCVVVCMSQ
jgi:hypothetical protein